MWDGDGAPALPGWWGHESRPIVRLEGGHSAEVPHVSQRSPCAREEREVEGCSGELPRLVWQRAQSVVRRGEATDDSGRVLGCVYLLGVLCASRPLLAVRIVSRRLLCTTRRCSVHGSFAVAVSGVRVLCDVHK